MKKLLLLITLGLGLWYWYDGKMPFMAASGAFDSAGNPIVWVFTFKDCGAPCQDAINDLKNRNTAFIEKPIDPANTNDADVKLWRAHGGPSFPLIVVGEGKMSGFMRSELAALLAESFGEKYLHATERRYFNAHFSTDGSPRIVMYSTDWCGYCKRLRAEFQENNVDFTEIDIEKVADSDLLATTMGIRGVPATWVGYRRVQGASLSDVKKAFR